jgi:hypothetical protein
MSLRYRAWWGSVALAENVHLFRVELTVLKRPEKNGMRRLIISCSLIAILGLVSAGQARADGNDNFSYQFGGNTFTWQLPASPNVGSDYTVGQDFYVPGVPYSVNGVAQGTGTFVFFSSLPGIGGGLELYNVSTTFINAFGDQVYGGPENAPSFVPGTYELNNGSATGPVGTLVISTPEPESLLLVSIGMVALIGFGLKKEKIAA